jgi:hypothetical protein
LPAFEGAKKHAAVARTQDDVEVAPGNELDESFFAFSVTAVIVACDAGMVRYPFSTSLPKSSFHAPQVSVSLPVLTVENTDPDLVAGAVTGKNASAFKRMILRFSGISRPFFGICSGRIGADAGIEGV